MNYYASVTILLIAITAVSAKPPVPICSSRYATVTYQRAEQTPQTVYGPPQVQETTVADKDITTEAITTESQSEQIQEVKSDKLVEGDDDDDANEEAVYYIYHPNGALQKVIYSTVNEPENRGYTAKLQYRDVEPISEPVFTYDPNTLVFQQIQF